MLEFLEKILQLNIIKTDIRNNGDDFLYNITTLCSKTEIDRLKEIYQDIFGVKVSVNEFPIQSETIELVDENKVVITLTQKLLPDESTILYLLDIEDFYKYETSFLKSVKIKDFKNRKNKIKIHFITNTNIQLDSPIFSIMDERLEIPKVILEKSEFNCQNVLALPKVVHTRNFAQFKDKAFCEMLSMISEKKLSDTEFILSFERHSLVSVDKINITETVFGEFNDLLLFIFENPEKYYERLNIFKSHFANRINLRGEIIETDFTDIAKNVRIDYNLFIADKINKYLSDKQKITEEYVKIHRDITSSIRVIVKDITQEIVVILGAVLTYSLLDELDNMKKILISSGAVALYLTMINILNCKKGWFFESESISKEKDRLVEMYQLLFNIEPTYASSLDEDFMANLATLRRIETVNKIFSCGLLFLCILIVLWA